MSKNFPGITALVSYNLKSKQLVVYICSEYVSLLWIEVITAVYFFIKNVCSEKMI